MAYWKAEAKEEPKGRAGKNGRLARRRPGWGKKSHAKKKGGKQRRKPPSFKERLINNFVARFF